jgi:proteasome accessory factor A
MPARRELDWVAKLRLLQGFRDREGPAWDAARLQLIDLQWADVRPEKGLYHGWLARGQVERLVTDEEVAARRARAAPTTPALLPRPLPVPVRRARARPPRGTR